MPWRGYRLHEETNKKELESEFLPIPHNWEGSSDEPLSSPSSPG